MSMKHTSEEWDVLDLTNAESKVLLALIERDTMSVSETARRARVARTTVGAALQRLQSRKLVRRVTPPKHTGHRSLWKASRPEKIKKELKEAAWPFEKETPQPGVNEIVGGIDSREIGITVFRGKQQILRAYEQMFRLSKAERVLFIQGNKSAEKSLHLLSQGYISEFHKKFKKAGVIMEGISGEHIFEIFKQLNIPLLKSHFGRLVVPSILPDNYMDFDLDILVMRDTVAFIDISAELVVLMRYPKLVKTLNNIARFLQDSGRKADLNTYIKQLIEEKERT